MKNRIKLFVLLVCFSFLGRMLFAQDDAISTIFKNHTFGDWKLNFGIESRMRYEYKHDFDFDKTKKDNGSLFFQRFRINTQALFKDKLEFFVEGLDGQVHDYQIKKTSQQDAFDLHQAYINLISVLNLPLDIKLGRQEMKYGKGRLIWASSWSNRINAFDESVLHWKGKSYYIDLFAGRVMNYDDNNFNRHEKKQIFSGIYSGYQKDKKSPSIEGYFLSLVDWSTNNKLERYTVGARLVAEIFKKIVLDIEAPYQFGKSGGQDISAYAFHLDLSRQFDVFLKPKVVLEGNLASGDKKKSDNKTNTFIPLYQSTHEPYGIMDFFRWQNMREAALNITISPHKKWKVAGGVNFFWLDRRDDSWYNSSGKKVRTDKTGRADRFVGEEASLVVSYNLNDYIKFDSGYAHFFAGPFVKDTGPHDDADWVYFQFQVKI